jgi:hypothetical protein
MYAALEAMPYNRRMRYVTTFTLAFAVAVACGGTTATGDGGADASGDAAPLDLTSCSVPGECDIRPKSCCGMCGAPTPSDMISINWQKGSLYSSAACPGGAACPACFSEPDPNLAPVCRSKACKAVDVRADDALSACKTDTDCRLRFSGCCEFCSSGSAMKLIALSTAGAAEYGANQCHPDATGCPKCAVIYPPDRAARCNPTTLHCEVITINPVDAGGGG